MEQKVAAALEALGIEGHEVLECDPELADTALFCARYGVSLEDSANAILVASKKPAGQLALCMVLATTRLDVNRAVRKAMGVKRLSFASAEQTREVTGMLIDLPIDDVKLIMQDWSLLNTRVQQASDLLDQQPGQ